MSVSIVAANGMHRDVSEIVVRDENNVPRTVSEIWVRDENNVSRQVWGGVAGGGSSTTPLAATASPDTVSGAISRKIAGPVATNSTTVTATGGTMSYSYAWAPQAEWTIGNPNAATTSFTATSVAPSDSKEASFACTVSDGITSVTVTVSALASNYYPA